VSWTWPFLAPIRATEAVWKLGMDTRRELNVSLFTQWCTLVRLGILQNFSSQSVYKFRLWPGRSSDDPTLYVQRHEIDVLLPLLHRGVDMQRLDDKSVFDGKCREFGFPVPCVLAFVRRGEVVEGDLNLPLDDVFVKYADWWCGHGAQLWTFSGHQFCRGDRHLSPAAFSEWLRERSHKRDVIVQERLRNSDSVSDLTSGALSTLRILTARVGDADPEVLLAALRMPVGKSEVDNFEAGGLAAGVTLDGRLTAAAGKRSLESYTHHPDTGALIEGRLLPNYEACTALACRAHAAFREPAFIGWDVAITPRGPLLIEANTR
jgi:hypothetical protein